MARCHSCSAPLPANNNRCSYCNIRNDVDLLGKQQFSISSQQSDRICPHCSTALQTVKLKLDEPIYIENCKTCFGLFFDPGEINTLLEHSVSNVFNINLEHLKNINSDRYQKNKKIKYIKCPVCQKFMRRINFGHRSGVIIDRCTSHGVWLDSGEITHLMEWKKAGGELLHAKENQKTTTRKNKPKTKASYDDLPIYQQQSISLETDLLETISALVYKLFT
ncbi:MAG: zf-TFIIB domain-containing protein [Methylococcaceae bacterium]